MEVGKVMMMTMTMTMTMMRMRSKRARPWKKGSIIARAREAEKKKPSVCPSEAEKWKPSVCPSQWQRQVEIIYFQIFRFEVFSTEKKIRFYHQSLIHQQAASKLAFRPQTPLLTKLGFFGTPIFRSRVARSVN
jgi:hypothetical protein